MRGNLILFTLAGSLLFAISAKSTTLASVTLSWNPSTSSNVAGYDIYYGTSSGNYATAVPVSNATNVTIRGLTSGQTYYFAAAAYNSSGDQSALSSEISGVAGSTTTSPVAALTSLLAPKSGQVSFTVSGASGYEYIVQGSTDLVHWVSLETNTATTFNFVDSNASQFSRRFYRTACVSTQ